MRMMMRKTWRRQHSMKVEEAIFNEGAEYFLEDNLDKGLGSPRNPGRSLEVLSTHNPDAAQEHHSNKDSSTHSPTNYGRLQEAETTGI
jgi:hypothetical protein